MALVEESDKLPQCSRCRGDLITSAVTPKDDAYGRPIHLELCAACDAEKPAAKALLRFLAETGGRDETRAEECARLLMQWTKEGMAAHGWYWQETPPGQH
ncbi:DUF6300 family protein [Streptomyces sp. NPDC004647]|uniref:DUF6300 family protein n=1 Tax=Streptomyces sp. NPDC004647 TaxID=3154671 RepID=UPI0033AC03F6